MKFLKLISYITYSAFIFASENISKENDVKDLKNLSLNKNKSEASTLCDNESNFLPSKSDHPEQESITSENSEETKVNESEKHFNLLHKYLANLIRQEEDFNLLSKKLFFRTFSFEQEPQLLNSHLENFSKACILYAKACKSFKSFESPMREALSSPYAYMRVFIKPIELINRQKKVFEFYQDLFDIYAKSFDSLRDFATQKNNEIVLSKSLIALKELGKMMCQSIEYSCSLAEMEDICVSFKLLQTQ